MSEPDGSAGADREPAGSGRSSATGPGGIIKVRGASAISDVRIRPHHLLCIQGFRGQGYSPKFIANLARVIDWLDSNPQDHVRIVAGADDICGSCPHLSDGACACPDQNVNDMDRLVLDHLGYTAGDKISWEAIVEAICQTFEQNHLHDLCSSCRWLDLEYCTRGLKARCGAGAYEDTNVSRAE